MGFKGAEVAYIDPEAFLGPISQSFPHVASNMAVTSLAPIYERFLVVGYQED